MCIRDRLSGARSARDLHGLVELIPVRRDAGYTLHRVRVKNEHHKRLVGDSLPLTREAVRGRALETEAQIVIRVTEHDHERTVALAENFQPSSRECRADALPLTIRHDRQWRQSHPDDAALRRFNYCRRKDDLAHYPVVVRHEREIVSAGIAELVDDVSLRRLI